LATGALCLVFWSQALVGSDGEVARLQASGRVVAIGDVHGSYEGLRTILRTTGLTDAQDRWIGGDAILVQTGDLMDRGADVREVFDLLRRLQREAPATGGRIVTLLGNHEIANLLGIFSPTSTDPEVFAELVGQFADSKSEKRQRAAFKEHRDWVSRYPGCGSAEKEEWIDAHPLGLVEYIEALSPSGSYGEWLREFPVAVRIGDTMFLHGGLSSKLEDWEFSTLEEIELRVSSEIDTYNRVRTWLEESGLAVSTSTLPEMLCAIDTELFKRTEDGDAEGESVENVDELVKTLRAVRASLPSGSWLVNHPDGPLWFRGYAFWTAEEGEAELPPLLERWGVDHFVVGHTPQRGMIKARFSGRVFLIDTALVFGEEAGGGPAALEIRDGVFSALYPEHRVALWDAAGGQLQRDVEPEAGKLVWKDADGNALPFVSSEDVEGFLRTASVVSRKDIPLGVTKPQQLLLDRDGLQAHAAFRFFHEESPRKELSGGAVLLFKDSYLNEVAAYEVAKLLDLDRVPPTVLRTVDGVEGSLQIWVEDTTMERDRREAGTQAPDPLDFERQRYDMQIFDNLVGNFDRNQGNILIDEDWKVWFIDHTRAFRATKSLPKADGVIRCSRALWEALRALDPEQLESVLEPYLPRAEIRSIIRRRDRIVDILEKRIALVGEARVLFDWGDPNPGVTLHDEPAQ
jgi:hypothetical protein